MYSFEGEYKRQPQQCLSGASIATERNVLLEHARQQRLMREEQRKRTKNTILFQAYVRSFLTRQTSKKRERLKFDQMVHDLKNNSISCQNVGVLVRSLLFFYAQEDNTRLVFVTQCILKEQEWVLQQAATRGSPWAWYLKWLLVLNLNHIVASVQGNGQESPAIALRSFEVFTCLETVIKAVGEDAAKSLVAHQFEYLFKKGYFEKVRFLIDYKTPPLLVTSSAPPTPLIGCLFDMIKRALACGSFLSQPMFSFLLHSLCLHILCPKLTDPIKMFVIPALGDLPAFPFNQLVGVLKELTNDQPAMAHSTGLLYAVLHLEKTTILTGYSSQELIDYLQVLGSLSRNFCKLGCHSKDEDLDDEEGDEGMEFDKDEAANIQKDEAEILEDCAAILNSAPRVQHLLQYVDEAQDPMALQALCQICHNLLVSNKLAVHKYRLLYMLAFKPAFLRHLWLATLKVSQTSVFGCATPLVNIIARGIPLSAEETDLVVPLLAVFCSLFSLLIATLHDSEFYGDDVGPGGAGHQTMPFSLQQLVPMTRLLKEVCLGLVELSFPDSRPAMKESIHGIDSHFTSAEQTHVWSNLFKVVISVVHQLHSRDNRRPFCPEGHWISKQVEIISGVYQPAEFAMRRRRVRGYRPFQGLRAFTREELEDQGPPLSTKEVRTLTLLNELPFLVAFEERVMVFQTIILRDKMDHQGEGTLFMQGRSIQISVRRNYLYEDAFDKLSVDNEPELRQKMRVQLVNRAGADEAGVDGGGLFREFLSELLKTAFDPNRGFFILTKDNMLYPNPNVHLLVDDFTRHYYFIGRILGKALYENLLVELPFAEFFLTKLGGRHSDVDIHHLASLDPIVYRNLLFLKSYEGDVMDLGLDFTILNDELGETRVEELKPGGSSIPVTSHNRIEYIHLMADYKVNRQIRAQCNAFRQGLANVIPLEWIHMFNNKELQVLISGAEIPVDVDDLRQHTNYAGGYTNDHPTIKLFWKVLDDMSDIQRRQLLKFVTSCSRPPLLGFKELDPPFCIQHAGSIDRLPTASTCMNLLKLPEFPDEKQMTDKLVYAIQAGAGFELS